MVLDLQWCSRFLLCRLGHQLSQFTLPNLLAIRLGSLYPNIIAKIKLQSKASSHQLSTRESSCIPYCLSFRKKWLSKNFWIKKGHSQSLRIPLLWLHFYQPNKLYTARQTNYLPSCSQRIKTCHLGSTDNHSHSCQRTVLVRISCKALKMLLEVESIMGPVRCRLKVWATCSWPLSCYRTYNLRRKSLHRVFHRVSFLCKMICLLTQVGNNTLRGILNT